jgi:outer membrane protein assembly factor BamB
MNNRLIATIALALVLICLVMAVTGFFTFAGVANTSKFSQSEVWSQPFADMQSMNIIDLTGDGQNDLFVQSTTTVGAYDANGNTLFLTDFPGPFVTTLGQVTDDTVEDIVVFWPGGVSVLDGRGQTLLEAQPSGLGQPYRAAVVRFASGPQIILGDAGGQLVALSRAGDELWRATLSSASYIRGLDDVLVGGVTHLAAADYDGTVGVYDEAGRQLWAQDIGGNLRRMRAYDLNGDGNGELLAGGEASRLHALDAASGAELFSQSLGQNIIEIRDAEIDGDPASREFVVGGRDGGAWAFRADGSRLWSASLSERVTEIAGIDVDDDGKEEVILGDQGGQVALFRGTSGARQNLPAHSSGITRIDAGRLTASEQIAVADAESVQVLTLSRTDAPFIYTPVLAGLFVSLVIAVAAWFIATAPAKPVLRVAVEDQSVEGLQARNLMLHESLADVERLRQSNEMPGDAYLARLRELRGELADTEAALQKAGAPVKVETFKCPHCGGTLPLGIDKCDYCGNIVIA